MSCACGCGQETKLASRSRKDRGIVKGQPLKFIYGHNGWRSPKAIKPAAPDPKPGGLYPPGDIETFIRGLGCWGRFDFEGALQRRDPAEYRRLLRNCIAVYEGRKDTTGKLHVYFARRELSALG